MLIVELPGKALALPSQSELAQCSAALHIRDPWTCDHTDLVIQRLSLQLQEWEFNAAGMSDV